MRRASIVIFSLLTAVVLSLHLVHRNRISYYANLIDTKPTEAGRGLAATALNDFKCGIMDTEYSKLAKAVFSVERLASGFLKRFFCDFILRLYVSLGLDPPDFSYGDGQIKISTLRRTHSDYVKDAPEAAKPKLTNLLLDHCVALEVAVNILRDEMTIHADPSGLLPRSEIARAAKTWNGQASSNSVEGAIANARYRELVYQTFIALRFFTTASGEESPR